MRLIAASVLLAMLLSGAASAQDACGPLKIVNTVQMVRELNGTKDFLPIQINGAQKYFILDTGGARTQIMRSTALDMNLPFETGITRLTDATGQSSSTIRRIDGFILGHLKSGKTYMAESPTIMDSDGLFALDYLLDYDADVDFGTDTLNFFSQNHCPGHVIYWKAPAVAVLPMTVDGASLHIHVPVEIDGQKFDAFIDSGAPQTNIRADVAQNIFHFTLGDAETPNIGNLNGVRGLPVYQHVFQNLTIGDIAVTNPHVDIIPVPPPSMIDPPRAIGNQPTPTPVIIGMDVLRKLHLYMAFKEEKLYVSAASPAASPAPRFPDAYIAAMIQRRNATLKMFPQSIDALASRCFWRGVANTDLDAALADCDQSLKLAPHYWGGLYGRGFVLYQQGKFQDAVTALDAATASPKSPEGLFLRGQAKQKLGDTAGGQADIAAAEALSPDIVTNFQRLGLAT